MITMFPRHLLLPCVIITLFKKKKKGKLVSVVSTHIFLTEDYQNNQTFP